MKKIKIKEVYAEPSKVRSGDQVKFIIKLESSEPGKVLFSIRELDGLLHYNGKEIFDKSVTLKKGNSTITFESVVAFAKPVDQFKFEMQLNAENIEIPPVPYKFNLMVVAGDQQKTA